MKRSRRIIPWLMVLSGLLIFAYPFVGNYLDRLHATVAVEEVRKELRQGKEEKEEAGEPAYLESEILYRQRAEAGLAVGVLSIPAIDLSVPIYEGADDDVLRRGIGHMPETDLPLGGNGTHTALSGHRGLGESELFVNLDRLVEGDRFTVEMPGQLLTYEVDRILVVEPQETEILVKEPGEDLCTLVTCTPRGINSHRLLVRGKRIFEEISEEKTAPTALHWESGWHRFRDLWTWLALTAILILGMEALWWMHGRRRR